MSDVFLVQPPVSFKSKDLKSDIIPDCPPLGLLYLVAGIEKEGFSVKLFDIMDGSLDMQGFLDTAKKDSPRVIGITAMTMNIQGAVELARFIKDKAGNEYIIVLGGPHVSADPDIVKRFPYFDFAITGEADLTFPYAVREIIKDGMCFSGVMQGETPTDLDQIPMPVRELVDYDTYIHKRGLLMNPIMASRGCPYQCIFCSIPAISKKCRFRSPKLVLEEMISAYKINKIKRFVFADDTLILNKNKVSELCDEIIKSDFDFEWEAQIRANLIDEELLSKMYKSGCRKVIFGVESGNERIRNEIIKKNISDEQIFKVIKLCRKYKIEPDIYLMVGFPTETKKELYDTVNFPLRVKPNMIGVHITTPLPGAKLYEQAIDEGVISENTIDEFINGKLGSSYKGSWPYYIPKTLTLDDMIKARSDAYRRFYFRLGYIIKRFFKDITSPKFLKRDLVQGLSLLRYGRSKDDR